MADNWQDACNFMAAMLGGDEAESRGAWQHMREQTPGAILDGVGGLAMTLLLRLAEERGGRVGGQVDLAVRKQIAAGIIHDLKINRPAFW